MRCSILLCVVLGLCVFTVTAAPTVAASGASTMDVPNDIVKKFKEGVDTWAPKLKSFANTIFLCSMTIALLLFGINAALGIARGEGSLPGIIGQFTMMLVFSCFILAVLNNYQEWTRWFIDKFQNEANIITGKNVDFMTPLNTGFEILKVASDKISINPATYASGLGYLIIGLIILIVLTLITAQMIFVWCESYVALSAAVIILGIGGGGGIFKDYAVNTMRYALAVTFKLFVMSLLMGLGMQFLDTLKANAAFEFPQFCVLVAVSIILLGLVKSIPDVCAGIIQGSHIGSGASLGSAIRTVASAGMTGMGAAWTLAKAPVTVPKAALRMGRNIRDAANLAGMKGKGGILGTIGELSNAQNEARMGKGQFRFGEQAGQNLQGKLADMRMRAGDGSSNTGGA